MEMHCCLVYIWVIVYMFGEGLSFRIARRNDGYRLEFEESARVPSIHRHHRTEEIDDAIKRLLLNEDRDRLEDGAGLETDGPNAVQHENEHGDETYNFGNGNNDENVLTGNKHDGNSVNFEKGRAFNDGDKGSHTLLKYMSRVSAEERSKRSSRHLRSLFDPIEDRGGFGTFEVDWDIPKRKPKFTFKNLLPYLKEYRKKHGPVGKLYSHY